jgi:hypothetical protein
VAREWQVPYSTLVRDWTAKDLELATAYLLDRDDVGPCGHPHSVSTRPENADRYVIDEERTCAACAALERHRAQQQRDNDTPEPGVLTVVLDKHGPHDPHDDTAFGPTFD